MGREQETGKPDNLPTFEEMHDEVAKAYAKVNKQDGVELDPLLMSLLMQALMQVVTSCVKGHRTEEEVVEIAQRRPLVRRLVVGAHLADVGVPNDKRRECLAALEHLAPKFNLAYCKALQQNRI